jgi:hypothetical protein
MHPAQETECPIRIDTQPYEAYDGIEETVQVAFYQRGTRQFLLEYYDACAETYTVTLYERDRSEWDRVAYHDFGAGANKPFITDVRNSFYAEIIADATEEELLDNRIGDLVRAVYGLWTDDFDTCLRTLGVDTP